MSAAVHGGGYSSMRIDTAVGHAVVYIEPSALGVPGVFVGASTADWGMWISSDQVDEFVAAVKAAACEGVADE